MRLQDYIYAPPQYYSIEVCYTRFNQQEQSKDARLPCTMHTDINNKSLRVPTHYSSKLNYVIKIFVETLV